MTWSMMKSSDSGGDGDEEDSGGGGGSTKAVKWRRQVSTTSASAIVGCRLMIPTMFVFFFLITGTAAVLSNSTFKGTVTSYNCLLYNI